MQTETTQADCHHMADWLLTKGWDYFFTATFRTPENRADRAVARVSRVLEALPPARVFLASEPFEKGDYHVHGLYHYSRYWAATLPSYRLSGATIFEALYQGLGRARVEEVNSPLAVTNYCAKYVSKRMSDYGFAGWLRDWQE